MKNWILLRWLFLLCFLTGVAPLFACPWCTNNALAKVTVQEGEPDPGGTFFGKVPDPSKVRRYFIAAEPTLWNYAPSGKDPVTGNPLPPFLEKQLTSGKLRYVQYTDETFTTLALPEPRLGIMGPVLRGVPGDFLVVTFLNKAARPLSMHPHGVRYDKESEGSSYFPQRGRGAAIAPNARFTYVWKVDEASAPRAHEPSSKAWLYHSHVVGDDESNLGLVGLIVVTDPRRARADGTPKDIDREMASLFMIFDESGLGAEAEAYELVGGATPAYPAASPKKPKTWAEIQELMELGARHAINGYIFGNTPGLEMVEGERVRWYLVALGSEGDLHTAHWHGLRVTDSHGQSTDVIELLPASMKVVDMKADNPGSWLYHCHVADHMMEGMYASFVVHPKNQTPDLSLGNAFFKTSGARESMQITSLAQEGKNWRVRGVFTIYERMTLRVTRLKMRLGNREAELAMNNNGEARAEGVYFKTLNPGSFGVMREPLLHFDLLLSGEEWGKAMAGTVKSRGVLKIHVDQASHQAKLGVRRAWTKAR